MVVSTARVSLRYAKTIDAEALFRYTGDIHSSKYLARKPHLHINSTINMLKKLSVPESLYNHGLCIWILYDNQIEMPVGMITILQNHSKTEIHFGLIKDYCGQGLAMMGLSLAAKYCYSSGISTEIVSFTDKKNVAAQRTLLNSGFRCVGSKAGFYKAPQMLNEDRDVYSYVYFSS